MITTERAAIQPVQTENKEIDEKPSKGVLTSSVEKFSRGMFEYLKYGAPGGFLFDQLAGLVVPDLQEHTCIAMKNLKRDCLNDMRVVYAGVCIGAPILEEILFREIIQSRCLHKLPKFIAKKISPGSEKIFDSQSAKVARIVIASALFSAIHLSNESLLGRTYTLYQTAGALFLGLLLGSIYENYGLRAAIGAHFANNFVAISTASYQCSLFEDTRTVGEKLLDSVL